TVERQQYVADFQAGPVGGAFFEYLGEDDAILGVLRLHGEGRPVLAPGVNAGPGGQRDLRGVLLLAPLIDQLDLVAGLARLQENQEVGQCVEILTVERQQTITLEQFRPRGRAILLDVANAQPLRRVLRRDTEVRLRRR